MDNIKEGTIHPCDQPAINNQSQSLRALRLSVAIWAPALLVRHAYKIQVIVIYTLFRQSEAAHNRYENDITDLN